MTTLKRKPSQIPIYKKRKLKSSISTTSIRHILTDIEGTTTSISFVHDILFGYIKDLNLIYKTLNVLNFYNLYMNNL